MKASLLFGTPGSQAMIVPVDPVAILPSQLFDYFCDRVEAMYDQMITEKTPTDMLATLDADIDDDKRLVKNSGPHDPSGKSCSSVEMKVHREGAEDRIFSFSLATALPGLVRIGRSSTDVMRGAARDVEKCANSTASQSAKRGAASAISRSCSAPSPAFSAAIAPGTQ